MEMRQIIGALIPLLTVTWITGCASLSQVESGRLLDSNLSNQNPAPPQLTPPPLLSGEEGQLDPVYMKSQADFYFTMGEAYSLEGQVSRAIESFKLTLVYDPSSVVVRLRLASEYVRQGLLSEALEHAQQALEQDPQSREARLLVAGLFSSLRMYDAALEQYETLLKQNPDDEDAPIYIGALLAEKKRYDEAAQYFIGLAKNPSNKSPERAYYYLGRIRSEQGEGHLKEAEAAFQKALQEDPSYAEAVVALANLMFENQRSKPAVRLLRSFQQKFGPSREVARLLSRHYLEMEDYQSAYEQLELIEGFERDNLNVRIQLALILIEQNKYEEAALRLEDILAQIPDLDKIRFYLGAVYEELKKGELATQNYARIPPASMYYPDAIIHTANIFKQSGQHENAINTLREAIRLREDVPQFYAFYATVLDDQRQYRQAISMLTKAVDLFPSHAQLRFFLGSMQDRVGDSDATIVQMKKVLEIEENHVQALNYLAYVYAEKSIELEAAEDMARRALALQPNDGYILDTVGWVMFKRGKLPIAVRYLEAAYKAKSDEAIIAEHLGDVYYHSQLFEKAKSMYERATLLEREPGRLEKIKEKIAAIRNQKELPGRMPASKPISATGH